MEITYYGHSCFFISTQGKRIIFDPFITPNDLAKEVKLADIKVDYILLSHGHQDHTADVEAIYGNSEATIISSFEVVSWFGNKGLTNGHPMNHGGGWNFDFGTVKMVNAVHSSSMPDGSYGGNPAGFVIQSEEKTFYFAGDTALHYDMQLIKERYSLDLAFLPIGDNFTMDIHDALKAAEFVGTDQVIGMHYDTFPYIKIDHEACRKLAEDKGIALQLLQIGETTKL